jgi:exodeoxyribonuclease VII small subunit
MPRKKQAANTPSFESLVERLQVIVLELEKGELPLERALALFEEGMGLTRAGMARLDEAEQRVQVLVEVGGRLIEEDREEEEEEEDTDQAGDGE